jgi:acetyl/propionyl-CoA carboxylase alpha subunit
MFWSGICDDSFIHVIFPAFLMPPRSSRACEKTFTSAPFRTSSPLHLHHVVSKTREYTSRHNNRHSLNLCPIFRTIKNRFAVQQHVRSIQTTSRLLEVVKVPPFADSVSEGDVKWVNLSGDSFLYRWHHAWNSFRFEKKVGDAVAADEVVMEIETDKTTVGVPSPAHGIIEEIYVADGDTVKSGQQLFKLKVTGEAPAAAAPKAEAPKPAAAAPPPPPPQAPKPAVSSHTISP